MCVLLIGKKKRGGGGAKVKAIIGFHIYLFVLILLHLCLISEPTLTP